MMNNCPCGSEQTYNQCCRKYHDGKTAPKAEALMRSRYSAYVLRNGAYLHRSWHSSTRPNKKSLLQLPATDWLGLEIVRTELGGEQDEQGIVEFIASYRDGEQISRLHETSRFVKENGKWYYLVGE
jgi:SEC-C motif-containing protein